MADLVNITIDGQKVTVPKGTLVIEAATQIGIDVPRFCYHPKLSAVGMCRMCLGEVGMPKMNPDKTPAMNEDGTPAIAMMPKPQTLCTTQAAEGMVILSETPAVIKMREGRARILLANHPLDCPVCDKGGECMLQDQTMVYARGHSRVQDMYHLRRDMNKDHPLSELITLDRERCIQCARCTRFQDEIAQDPVLELVARGSKTMIDTLSDPPFRFALFGQHHRHLSGRRAHQPRLPLQGARLGTEEHSYGVDDRRQRHQHLCIAAQRDVRARHPARQRSHQRMLDQRPRPLRTRLRR
jgi:NADH-quinone oxidoreductase subunit G